MEVVDYPEQASIKKIISTWWPLAASWLLMTIEIPALSAVIARLADPQINLAAYGGIIFPVALLVEAPIVMLLSASVALCKDWNSYQKLFRFMMIAAGILTLVHVLIAFTPIYYFIARIVIKVPESVVEPGRLGLMIMTPWTWSIAYRRFQQGVLIRFGFSDAVGKGTVIRLTMGGLVLAAGYLLGSVPGVVVGAMAQALGVMSEAFYAGIRVQPVLKKTLRGIEAQSEFSWNSFAKFYIPLALTSFMGLMWQSIGSAALSRMPDPLISLAIWPVVSGLVNMFRSFGFAVNEVVIALLSNRKSYQNLLKFVVWLSLIITGLQLFTFLTPLARFWFSTVSALPVDWAETASFTFLLGIPMAGLTIFQSWFQGALVNGKQTRAIPEGTALFLVVILAVLGAGILTSKIQGVYVGMFGFVVANLAQLGWTWYRSRNILNSVRNRE